MYPWYFMFSMYYFCKERVHIQIVQAIIAVVMFDCPLGSWVFSIHLYFPVTLNYTVDNNSGKSSRYPTGPSSGLLPASLSRLISSLLTNLPLPYLLCGPLCFPLQVKLMKYICKQLQCKQKVPETERPQALDSYPRLGDWLRTINLRPELIEVSSRSVCVKSMRLQKKIRVCLIYYHLK